MANRRLGSLRFVRPAAMAALLSVALSPATAATQWGAYQWAQTPVQLYLYENVSPSATGTNWLTYLSGGQGAAQDWSPTNGPTHFDPQLETATVDPRKCPARTGQVEVCNHTYGRNGWLGVAQIWTSGDYIQKGSVKLNDSYFDMSAYSSDGWKYLVACQEVGHTLGLSHDDTTFGDTNFGTCMDYTSYPDDAGTYYDYANGSEATANNRMPNDNDYGLLVCMYQASGQSCPDTTVYANSGPSTGGSGGGGGGGGNGHGHGKPLSVGPTDFGIRIPGEAPPVDFLSADGGNSPAEWGRAVAFTKDGRGRVFEREIAPGKKIITEVFWAPHP